MSLEYITECDGCGLRAGGWSEAAYHSLFTTANEPDSKIQRHYCSKCWTAMKLALPAVTDATGFSG